MSTPALLGDRSRHSQWRPTTRQPPRLRTIEDRDERHASPLELFFDLVFVVAVAALGETLTRHATSVGFLHFAVLFVPVWWTWVGYTFYADRFDTDDPVLRLAMLTAMLAVAWLAVEIPRVFASPGGAARFAAAYAAVRFVLAGLYLRADHHEPKARPLTRRYIVGFTAGALLWLASVWVPAPTRYVLWGIGILIELTPPLLSSAAFRRVPFHVSHIPERFAAVTIIALGETVVLDATGVGTGDLGAKAAVAAVFAFVLAACLWWLYFDFADATPLGRRLLAPQTYAYGHLLVFAGITATGAGALLAIRAGGDSLEPGGRWALCGGAAVFLRAIAAIQLVNVGVWQDRRIWSRLTTAVLLAALAGSGSSVPADALTISVAALLIAAVLAEAALAVSTPSEPITEVNR